MEIREATETDIPEILMVLKASLGETSSKKSEEVWKYKHVDNPFGKSLVLLAVEAGEIVGVRAFMRWTWCEGEKSYSAFRAVDTATHPDHQGKGIFKKLTLEALSLGETRGDNFVFNTPNSQSKPGYLKMGWQEIGKLRISLNPVNPVLWKGSFSSVDAKRTPEFPLDTEILKNFNRNLEKGQQMFTPKDRGYLKWRYLNNPLQKYLLEITPDFFIAGYLKNQGRFRELRISEIIFNSTEYKRPIRRKIREWAHQNRAHFISFSPLIDPGFLFGMQFSIGPVMTLKKVNLTESHFEKLLKLDSWSYSLGDLELF